VSPPREQDAPAEVRQLIVDLIDSFEKLEVLVLLCRHRDAVWSVVTASEELRLTPEATEEALDGLVRTGLLALERDNGRNYQFRPANPDMGEAATQLCALYDEDRVLVINLLATTALERIKSSAARTFADAFRLRSGGRDKGKKDG
jgi:hypothetical protein